MGQAKSGNLPRPLTVTDPDPVLDLSVGEIYYSPSNDGLVILYDDLGQQVPPPGLLRLGMSNADWTQLPTPADGSPSGSTPPRVPETASLYTLHLRTATNKSGRAFLCVLLSCTPPAMSVSKTGQNHRS